MRKSPNRSFNDQKYVVLTRVATKITFHESSKIILSLLILKASQANTGLLRIKRDKIRSFPQYIVFTF